MFNAHPVPLSAFADLLVNVSPDALVHRLEATFSRREGYQALRVQVAIDNYAQHRLPLYHAALELGHALGCSLISCDIPKPVTQQTYTVVAGKYEDDGQRNYKYISAPYLDLDAAKADLAAYLSYPFAEIEPRLEEVTEVLSAAV